jgi:hypothetical protein
MLEVKEFFSLPDDNATRQYFATQNQDAYTLTWVFSFPIFVMLESDEKKQMQKCGGVIEKF